MVSFLVFLWGVFNFSILWLALKSSRKKDWRNAFISASLYFGVSIWFIAEVLSLLNQLNRLGIFCGCFIYSLSILFYLFYSKKKTLPLPRISFSKWKSKSVCFIIFILGVTLFIAIVYPPSTWDSMTYHLPRIEHWLQNGNLNHYYTTIERQLFSAPFAELSIMFGRALSANDYLANLPQWFAFFGSLIVISQIAKHLGIQKKGQIIASLFFATLPTAILQATSTQNDLVVTFWLLCILERFLVWKKDKNTLHSIEFGIALGLAILTKGTAYTIALPIVLIFAIISLAQYKRLLLKAVLAAMVCLALNTPHYVRNYIEFKNPIEADKQTMSSFTIKSFAITLFSNIYHNASFPILKSETINREFSKIGKDIFPYSPLKIYGFQEWRSILKNSFLFHEDTAKNPIHILLIILAAFFILFRRGKKKRFVFIILACWCSFSFFIPWQPWITRLQIPLFALSAPLIPLALLSFKRKKMVVEGVLVAISLFALFPLFFNFSRPIIAVSKSTPILGGRTSPQSIWNSSRDELLFINKPHLYKEYKTAYQLIPTEQRTQVGLIIGLDAWEYPLWYFIRKNDKQAEIKHQEPKHIDSSIEYIFSLENKNIEKIFPYVNDSLLERPLFFHRNPLKNSRWDLLTDIN